jgi:hypothetical protein
MHGLWLRRVCFREEEVGTTYPEYIKTTVRIEIGNRLDPYCSNVYNIGEDILFFCKRTKLNLLEHLYRV